VSALHDAGLFRMLLPRSLEGAELDPPTFVQVTEAIARADASTAWVICQTNGCSMTAAYLRPDVAREIFGGEPAGVPAWGPPATSKAVAVDRGHRLSGTFNFGSGTISQQVQGRDDHFETVGKFLLGLEPDTTFL